MRFIHLDSIDDERVAAYVNLTEIQLRNRLEPSKGLFIAESPKVIDRALAAGREPIPLLVEVSWIDGMSGMFDVIEKRWGDGIPVYVASPEQLKRLTGYRLHRRSPCRDETLVPAQRRRGLPWRSTGRGHGEYRRPHECGRSHAFGWRRSTWMRCSSLRPVATRCTGARRACPWSTVFQVPWTRIGGDDKHYWPFTGMRELHRSGIRHRRRWRLRMIALLWAELVRRVRQRRD